jgi:hypothetical protein
MAPSTHSSAKPSHGNKDRHTDSTAGAIPGPTRIISPLQKGRQHGAETQTGTKEIIRPTQIPSDSEPRGWCHELLAIRRSQGHDVIGWFARYLPNVAGQGTDRSCWVGDGTGHRIFTRQNLNGYNTVGCCLCWILAGLGAGWSEDFSDLACACWRRRQLLSRVVS